MYNKNINGPVRLCLDQIQAQPLRHKLQKSITFLITSNKFHLIHMAKTWLTTFQFKPLILKHNVMSNVYSTFSAVLKSSEQRIKHMIKFG